MILPLTFYEVDVYITLFQPIDQYLFHPTATLIFQLASYIHGNNVSDEQVGSGEVRPAIFTLQHRRRRYL